VAKTALRVKQARKPKFGVRAYTRCQKCGRPKAVYRKFGLCPQGRTARHHQVLLVTNTTRRCQSYDGRINTNETGPGTGKPLEKEAQTQ
jgi:ribosomal protein S14